MVSRKFGGQKPSLRNGGGWRTGAAGFVLAAIEGANVVTGAEIAESEADRRFTEALDH